LEELNFLLKRVEYSIGWQRIEASILSNFGTFKDLEVVELGSGIGKASLLMAQRGAKVTCLDFSEAALEKAREIFAAKDLPGEFIKGDALSLAPEMTDRFSVAMSWGLAEHFTGEDRFKCIKSHFDALKKGGMFFIIVPNNLCFPYRIYKFMFEIMGKWKIAAEYPFSKKELKDICKRSAINGYYFLGSSFFASFQFLDLFYFLARALKLKEKKPDPLKLVKEKASFLDKYFGAVLILSGRK
jgi:cyclopropane fatty-acyl-phospholipid synthase-like methyltransferase